MRTTNPLGLDAAADNVYGCQNCGELYAYDETKHDTRSPQANNYCGNECYHEDMQDRVAFSDDDDMIDGVGFADPGGNSALRAATASNPRNLACPSCRAPNRLTRLDRERGYQCDSCADQVERGGC